MNKRPVLGSVGWPLNDRIWVLAAAWRSDGNAPISSSRGYCTHPEIRRSFDLQEGAPRSDRGNRRRRSLPSGERCLTAGAERGHRSFGPPQCERGGHLRTGQTPLQADSCRFCLAIPPLATSEGKCSGITKAPRLRRLGALLTLGAPSRGPRSVARRPWRPPQPGAGSGWRSRSCCRIRG